MTNKVDFSKLVTEDNSLLSWEDMFPEYAVTEKSSPKQTEKKAPVLSMENLPNIPLLTDDAFNLSEDKSEPSVKQDWLERALAESDELLKQTELPEKNQDYWAMRFNQLNFPGMDLMAVGYIGSLETDLLEQHQQIKKVTRDFLRLLSYNYINDLRSAGVSEEGIFYMKKGKIPENFTVHLKYPLAYGGKIDFNNMVFLQDKPFHDLIHNYLDEQLLTSNGLEYPPLLYVPTPTGKIYVPFGMFTGSGGKNKQDRSVYAGFSKAAFDKIALKSMPGR